MKPGIFLNKPACLFILLLSFYTIRLSAQQVDTASYLKVGVYVSPPFVMEEAAGLSGMSMELWDTIAARLQLPCRYEIVPTLRELVSRTSTGNFDVAVTNLTITQNRALRIDFTQPWYDAGLRIMIDKDRGAGLYDVISGLYDAGHLRAYAWLILVILVATLLLTLFDRKFDKDFPRRWREGLAESFYHVMSVSTSGGTSRKNLFGWKGRIFSALWLVCGVAVIAYVTSSITSVMTTLSLRNQVHGLADLSGKTVGVFTGSVSEEYMSASGMQTLSYNNIDEAVRALHAKEIAAIIGDAPVLEYYGHTHPEAPVAVVGRLFRPDKYGFGLPLHSPLTKRITVELLGARERGLIAALRRKYLGETR
ncbi:transporter substrate-binding domain-containing protein [Chitinophaga japonensis]|uniref:Ligand-gated ion channel n=1 Tax=Chitinophaga japonensis TaxID=104662 RepID=A0A562SS04_CHIJA|nr:transporter substrate-binding domain-containing protein [Chitinophaga japonensis]TWI84021.1 ligand-gated ion channel [Chitinophaga japonensis]